MCTSLLWDLAKFLKSLGRSARVIDANELCRTGGSQKQEAHLGLPVDPEVKSCKESTGEDCKNSSCIFSLRKQQDFTANLV